MQASTAEVSAREFSATQLLQKSRRIHGCRSHTAHRAIWQMRCFVHGNFLHFAKLILPRLARRAVCHGTSESVSTVRVNPIGHCDLSCARTEEDVFARLFVPFVTRFWKPNAYPL